MKIVFVDRSTQLQTVEDLNYRARGGMVTSLFRVSDYLSLQGNEVFVIAGIETEGETPQGTQWLNGSSLLPTDCDVLVCNRGIGSGYSEIKAKHRVLWTHDLPHSGWIPEPKNIKAFSATVFMSNYAERIWRSFYKDIGKSCLIPNGVDKDVFYPRKKDWDYLIFASAPNRGLKRLPFIFDCVSARVKQPVYMKAFSNLEILHPNEGQDTFSDVYEQLGISKVEILDPLPQIQFADELGKAGLMVLPSDYPEICSNVILQSLASGTPVVTTGELGSAHEWVNRSNGRLTDWQPHDYMTYQVDVIRKVVEILENRNLHQRLSRNSANANIETWDQIGARWLKMLKKLN